MLSARQDGLEIKEVWVHPMRDQKVRRPRLRPDRKRPVCGVHQSGEVRVRLPVLEQHADRQELALFLVKDLSVKRVLARDVELIFENRELVVPELHVPEVEDVGLVREVNSMSVIHKLCYGYVRQIRILVVIKPEDALGLPRDVDVLDDVNRRLLLPAAASAVRQR